MSQPPIMDTESRARQLAGLRPFKPGVSGNPGGQAKGKRISTWIAEFGEMSPDDWPKPKSKEYARLPGNAQVALKRLREALDDSPESKRGLDASEYVESHKSVPETGGAASVPMIEQIVAAMIALKASGWTVPQSVGQQEQAAIEAKPEPSESESREDDI